jgi:4-carboxymuconolactone decarboxylase
MRWTTMVVLAALSALTGCGSARSVSGGAVMALNERPSNEQSSDERYERGIRKLEEIDGRAGKKVVDSLRDLAPDFARYLIEFPFGDVYSRPGLDLRSREVATVAALTALGNARPQLAVHIHGALNVGCTRKEVIEIMIQMAVYAGFPAALNGLSAAREVFAERDAEGRHDR